jgi:hypothetical protein
MTTLPVYPTGRVEAVCFVRLLSTALLVLLACPVALPAAEAASAPPAANLNEPAAADESPQEFSKVRGLFDIDLPATVKRYDLKLSFQPHFGDFTRKAYVRIPVGARFGLNDRTEVDLEAEAFVTHGLKAKHESYGFYALRFGTKYQWAHWLKDRVVASTGFTASIPVGRPPLELTDGLNHFAPYVVFSRTYPQWPKFAPFVSFGMDLVSRSSVPGTTRRNTPTSDAMGMSPGFIYDAGVLKYTLVLNYSTTALIGQGSNHFYGANPSVLWQLPRRLTFNSNGKWVFGFGLKMSKGPDGTDTGTSVKLRGEFKFTRLLAPLRRATSWAR